jgi:SAM-dependent methyltransferase
MGQIPAMNKLLPEDDLYGQVFMDYFQNNLKGETYLIRDDGYRDLFEVKEYFSSPDNFAPVENSLLKFARPDKVLDVGCGAGRFSLYFQDLNWNVTALDNSPLISQIAKTRGVKRVINDDILKTRLPFEYFNTILLLGNNIGIGGTLDGAEKLLQKLFHTCTGGGRLLLTSLNISRTQEKHHLSYHEARRKEGRYIGEVRLRVEYNNRVGHYFPWLLVESEVLVRIAQKTGWNVKELIDEYFYGMVLEKTGGIIPT